MQKIRIHYFTGTGNTAHAALRLAESFREKGMSVETVFVTKGLLSAGNRYDLEIFLFPVYAFTMPGTMKIYLRHFPKPRDGKPKVAVVANHGMLNMEGGLNTGYESQSLDEAARALRRKGFDVVYMEAVGYPENITILANALQKKTVAEIVAAADGKLDALAEKLTAGERKTKKYFILEKLLSGFFGFVFTYIGKWHIGKMYVADRSCTGCGLCAKHCPSHAIRLFRKKPKWNLRCDACLGCYNFCPETAIQVSLLRVLLIFVITIGLIPFVMAVDHVLLKTIAGLSLFRSIEAVLTGADVRVIFGILLYVVAYVPAILLMDLIVFLLEQIPFLNFLTRWTYTRKYKRYLAPGYNPFRNK